MNVFWKLDSSSFFLYVILIIIDFAMKVYGFMLNCHDFGTKTQGGSLGCLIDELQYFMPAISFLLKIIKFTKLFKLDLDLYWNVSFSKDFHGLGTLLMTSSCVSKMRDCWLAVFNLYRKNDSLRFVCWKGKSLKRLFQQ